MVSPRQFSAPGRRIIALAFAGLLFGIAPSQATAVPRDFFGVVPQDVLTTGDFERMGQAKVGTLRIGIHWPALQRTRAESNEIRDIFDDEFGRAAANGIQVLPFVNNTPDWIRPDEDLPPIDSARHRDDFQRFMRLLVERYGSGGEYWTTEFRRRFPDTPPMPVKDWQIWNEPSSPASWEPRPDPKEYGRLVKLAETAIHDVEPGANVMTGGNFFAPLNQAIKAPEYTRRLLKVDGVKSAIDSVAIHPYAGNFSKVAFQIEAIHKVLSSNGAGDKELFITETGWSTARGSDPIYVSEQEQAKLLKQVFGLAAQKKRSWNIGGITWYSWRDLPSGAPACSFCAKTGLFKASGSPKPSWDAFKSFTLR